jgi:hypothetical protein
MHQQLRIVKRWIPRSWRFFYQRWTRGWDDSDTWSLDSTVSALVLPRLRRFKEVNIAHPGSLTSEEWDAMLDKMIAAFEFGASEERWLAPEAEYAKHQEGVDLFAKYFWHLWW